MKRLFALLFLLPLAALAQSPGVGLDSLPSAGALGGTELLFGYQAGTGGSGATICARGWCPVSITPAQIKTYIGDTGAPPAGSQYQLQINGGGGNFGYISNVAGGILIGQTSGAPIFYVPSGDLTMTNGGVFTVVKVNGLAVPASEGCVGTNSSSQLIAGSCGGSPAFSAITSATNTTAAMVVGSGASLATSGSGTIAATSVPNTAVTAGSYTAANITVAADGRITAAANGSASATSITPGTTTVVGATAPCLIENSASTTMGCAALGTGVATALGVNVGSAGAPVVNGGALGTPSSGVGTNLSGTASALNIGGTAANLSGTPALPNGTTGTTQATSDNTTKLATDAFVIANAASAGVSSVAAGGGISIAGTGSGPYTGAVTVSASYVGRVVSGTTDTILSTDCGNYVKYTSSSSVAVTFPQATGSFAACSTDIVAAGTGTVTVTPTTSTVNGGATLAVVASKFATITADSGNYDAIGTAVGALTQTIASGTAVLNTAAIADGVCEAVVTVAASGVVTTDTITAGFNQSMVGVTGYDPSSASYLRIQTYPTAGDVNFLVCNKTGAGVTPAAATLNWRVAR